MVRRMEEDGAECVFGISKVDNEICFAINKYRTFIRAADDVPLVESAGSFRALPHTILDIVYISLGENIPTYIPFVIYCI